MTAELQEMERGTFEEELTKKEELITKIVADP